MSSNILDILAKRHDEWIKMANSFKLNNNDAKELVQEMYLRMYNYTKDVNRIMYNEKEINKAINFCKVASGKHADKSAKMKANKAIKSLNQALKDLG